MGATEKTSSRHSSIHDYDTENHDQMVEELQQALSEHAAQQEQAEKKRRASKKLVNLLFEGSPLSEDNIRTRMRKIHYRFRALVRLMANTRIAPSLEEGYQEAHDAKTTSNLPIFNVNLYKRRQKAVQLSPMIKKILLKPPEFRREDESELIYKSICQLSFLDHYSQQTLMDMARVLNYQFVETGRVIVKQGQLPLAYYIVLSGILVMTVDEKDEATNRIITRNVAELKAGDTWGQIALINNIPRIATVTCKYASELLWLDKDDFNLLLRANAQHEWTGRFNAMSTCKYFKNWTPKQIEDCSNDSKMLKFEDETVILGNTVGRPDYLYFITNGKCRVVEVLRLLSESVGTYSKRFNLKMAPLHVPSKELIYSLPTWQTLVRRFLHIMTLEKGQFFGAGENLKRRYIVAWGKVECIQISHAFLRRHDQSDWVELLQDTMQAALPSHSYVFQEFVERATWRAYKHGLLQDLVSRSKKPLLTEVEDVPLSIRQEEERENWNTVQM